MTAIKILLFITVGQTDVQLVMSGRRHKLYGNSCGTLHDAIKERMWSVIDAPSARSRDFINRLLEGKLKLCTSKLDAMLLYFDQKQPTSVLIFETKKL